MADTWEPDGNGLPAEAFPLINNRSATIHLRLHKPGHYPKAGCDNALGEWWTGKVSEVTCPDCLKEYAQ